MFWCKTKSDNKRECKSSVLLPIWDPYKFYSFSWNIVTSVLIFMGFNLSHNSKCLWKVKGSFQNTVILSAILYPFITFPAKIASYFCLNSKWHYFLPPSTVQAVFVKVFHESNATLCIRNPDTVHHGLHFQSTSRQSLPFGAINSSSFLPNLCKG